MKNKISFLIILFVLSFTSFSVLSQNNFTANDTIFVDLRKLSDAFIYDMKYASEDNFLKENVYGCDSCFVRTATAKALVKANEVFIKKGYRIKIYDCYRPLDIQRKMWKIVPNAKYVADPNKGSVHNRGGAIDITLVDSQGKELDMGTDFDHFGVESAHSYKQLESTVIANRQLLKTIMEENGFTPIKSEWWHYDLIGSSAFEVANHRWNCD